MTKRDYHDLPRNYLRPTRKVKPNFPGSFGFKLLLFCLLVFIAVFMLHAKHATIPFLSGTA